MRKSIVLVILLALLYLAPAKPAGYLPETRRWVVGLRSDTQLQALAAARVIPEIDVAVVAGPKPKGDYRYVSPVRKVRISGDPSASPWHLEQMRRDAALEYAGDWGVSLAVIDTGVDTVPSELPFYDNTRDCVSYVAGERCNASDGDNNGHGTLVAGLAASRSYGTAPGDRVPVRLRAYKALDEHGWGDDVDAVQAIVDAAGHDVINLSFGRSGFPEDDVLCDAVAYAVGQGSIVVAAAGNSGHDGPHLPADCEGATAVVATNVEDWKTWWSNGCAGHERCFGAPGDDVMSIGRVVKDGTSMAAPLVSGTALLALSRNPEVDVYAALRDGAVIPYDPPWNENLGWGRVDALGTLEEVAPAEPFRAWVAPILRSRRPPEMVLPTLPPPPSPPQPEPEVYERLNEWRAREGLPELAVDERLEEAAAWMTQLTEVGLCPQDAAPIEYLVGEALSRVGYVDASGYAAIDCRENDLDWFWDWLVETWMPARAEYEDMGVAHVSGLNFYRPDGGHVTDLWVLLVAEPAEAYPGYPGLAGEGWRVVAR